MCLGTSTDVLSTVSRMFILLLSCFLLAGANAQDDLGPVPVIFEEKYELCTTEACNATAKEILSGMDDNTEPCMDFYNFVCKNWRYSNPDIPGLKMRTQFTNAEINFSEKIKNVLETTAETNESEGLQLAKKLYSACMNSEDTKEEQLSYLRDVVRGAGSWILANPLGVVPVSAEQMDQHLTKAFGISWMHDISYAPFLRDRSWYSLTIKPPTVVRPPFADGSVEGKKKYAAFVDKVVRMFVGEEEYAFLPKDQLAEEINDLLEFEEAVVKTLGYETKFPYCDSFELNLSELQRSFSGTGRTPVDWEARLKPLLPPNREQRVTVTCVGPVLTTLDLISQYSDRTIMNYIIWNFLMRALPMIDTDLRNTIYPQNAQKPRWQQCVEENDGVAAVYYHILKKDAEANNDKQALDIYDVMEAVTAWRFLGLKDRLRGTSLRLKAYELHEQMATHFKTPEPYFSATEYEKYFPHADASQLYAENILTKAKYRYKYMADFLAKPFDPQAWPQYHVSPLTVHVHGGAFKKARYVPAGALEMPFYHKDRPQSLNYGALGSVFGKSFMTEYYDYLVAAYRGDSRIVPLSEHSQRSFKNNAEYAMERWNDYPLKRKASKDVVNVNDMHELYSHNAQSDAIRVAFDAYEREFKLRRWKDVRLPGLEKYNHKQLFFLSYVNAHCAAPSRLGLTKNEEISQAVLGEIDMEPRRKVILSLLQSDTFAETFNCKTGTWMHPFGTNRFW